LVLGKKRPDCQREHPLSFESSESNIRVGAHVTNDRQAAVRRRESLGVDERRDLGGKVDAVNEDVCILDNLPEGTT
jgi:hypothetical protein